MAIDLDANRYKKLSPEDFDALVTGELAHYAIWLEGVLVDIISDFFAKPSRKKDFVRLMLHRDGLTFQQKIEIVRAMLPLFKNIAATKELKALLTKTEAFKADRNAFAHGLDVTPKSLKGTCIHVEIVTRSGKEKRVEVTAESHTGTLEKADALFNDLTSAAKRLND